MFGNIDKDASMITRIILAWTSLILSQSEEVSLILSFSISLTLTLWSQATATSVRWHFPVAFFFYNGCDVSFVSLLKAISFYCLSLTRSWLSRFRSPSLVFDGIYYYSFIAFDFCSSSSPYFLHRHFIMVDLVFFHTTQLWRIRIHLLRHILSERISIQGLVLGGCQWDFSVTFQLSFHQFFSRIFCFNCFDAPLKLSIK